MVGDSAFSYKIDNVGTLMEILNLKGDHSGFGSNLDQLSCNQKYDFFS